MANETGSSPLGSHDVDSPSVSFSSWAANQTRRLIWLFFAWSHDELALYFEQAETLIVPGGGGKVAFPEGRTEIRGRLSSMRANLPPNLVIVRESYIPASLGSASCSVVALVRFSGFDHDGQLDASSPTFDIAGTFVWTNRPGERPRLVHCHCSESTVNPGSKSSRNNGDSSAGAGQASGTNPQLQVRDAEGTTYWLAPTSVIYIKAAHQYTDIYCTERRLRIHSSFSSTVDQLRDTVMTVHRSYAVNPSYVSHLEGGELHLTTGATVPVPQKSVSKVRAMLQSRLTPTA